VTQQISANTFNRTNNKKIRFQELDYQILYNKIFTAVPCTSSRKQTKNLMKHVVTDEETSDFSVWHNDWYPCQRGKFKLPCP